MEPTSDIKRLFGRDVNRGNTIFHEIAELGSLLLLNRIFKNVDERLDLILQTENYNGELSIHVAAKKWKGLRAIELIKMLVKLGANLNAAEEYSGYTVCHEAVCFEDDELLQWLCQQPGINLDAKTMRKKTAYQMAFRKNNTKLMGILRDHGADCELREESESESSGKED